MRIVTLIKYALPLAALAIGGANMTQASAPAGERYSAENYCARTTSLSNPGTGFKYHIENGCSRPMVFFWCYNANACNGIDSVNAQDTVQPGSYTVADVVGIVHACEAHDDFENGWCIRSGVE